MSIILTYSSIIPRVLHIKGLYERYFNKGTVYYCILMALKIQNTNQHNEDTVYRMASALCTTSGILTMVLYIRGLTCLQYDDYSTVTGWGWGGASIQPEPETKSPETPKPLN